MPAAAEPSPAEVERLMSDPRVRELQYKLAHGGEKFKLEEVRNIVVPEGASEEEQMAALQRAMEEEARNKQREADEEARRAAAAKAQPLPCRAERIAQSDPWCYVLSGAGTAAANGTYMRDGTAVKNGARVYGGARRASDGGGGGQARRRTLAKQPGAYADRDTLTRLRRPAVGNAAFKKGDHAAAVQRWSCQQREECRVVEVRRGHAGLGREQVLAQQEEYRVAALARSGKEAVLSELSGLLGRLSALVRRKGTASEVTSLLRQLPSLLASLKTKPTDDPAVPGGLIYESAPNHDAQVYVRLATNGFALLAPLLRPMPKGSRGGAGGRGEEWPRSAKEELLGAALETVAAAVRDCPTNMSAFDKYVPQLVPILRAKAATSLEVLRSAVRLLGAMGVRASARRVMHDPATAEGLMHVLSFPDSSSQRLHVAIIAALEDMRDTGTAAARLGTLANLLAVEGAPETFWREAHSRNKDVNGPSRGLIGTAMTSAVCRRRLGLRERTKRLVELVEKMTADAPVREEYVVARRAAGAAPAATGDDDDDEVKWPLRDVAALPESDTRALGEIARGLADEAAADDELVEALTRHGAWRALVPLCVARPPLSAGAIRCLRVGMGRTQAAIDAGAELGLPLWLLGCREPSDASEDFNANVATTLLAQAARDDACQLLGYVANQAVVHESAELYDPHDVLHAAIGLLSGSPSDDAACGGGRALLHLLRYQRSARLPALSARDVHDVLVPLFLRKSGEAKEALMRPLRVAMADTAWMEAAWPYFESRGSAAKVQQVVHEMNGLEEMKAIATTGKAPDAMRPNAAPLADSLEAQHRVENLQPAKVAAFLAADLPPGGAVLDVGAGTGLFTFPLAAALPASQIVALEGAAPSLPGGAKASLVLLCDVLELVPEHAREGLVGSLRALLAPGGKLAVICARAESDSLLIDAPELRSSLDLPPPLSRQDAGFLQRRVAQALPEAAGGDPTAAGGSRTRDGAEESGRTREGKADGEADDDEDGSGCILEENPDGGGQARGRDVEDSDEDEDGCILEENPDGGGQARGRDVEDSDEDEDGCILEENPDGGGQARGRDGCMLEDNA
ncbi:hypothetical protein EMIHUDRAFT_448270 [Emiliania huxleyi CCMP1516]|uniref:TOG domain-containing protein n=2 Tax=Emiliania huxleyi TaxID=2903 RepID=A0A0D3IUF8_EMIH1|nr:hypothetical protein EMIHUDRAFT_448270 [Emiliania huxleyi CCMP1516]EOD14893.1 hypothetical protein EMIHUDRAFT_448270 [Emiliania huxleyi CCMP1516]|eukprot:XP_005767322.1 hypothetical protein EMIHUDRAFT_448270 [Emiliania huxleyi CCMP1516]